jgi:hypothetical protein
VTVPGDSDMKEVRYRTLFDGADLPGEGQESPAMADTLTLREVLGRYCTAWTYEFIQKMKRILQVLWRACPPDVKAGGTTAPDHVPAFEGAVCPEHSVDREQGAVPQPLGWHVWGGVVLVPFSPMS